MGNQSKAFTMHRIPFVDTAEEWSSNVEIPQVVVEPLRRSLTAIARLFKAPRIGLVVLGPSGDVAPNAKGDLYIGTVNPSVAIVALRKILVQEAEKFADDPASQKDVIRGHKEMAKETKDAE
jgi:hypothetical protein